MKCLDHFQNGWPVATLNRHCAGFFESCPGSEMDYLEVWVLCKVSPHKDLMETVAHSIPHTAGLSCPHSLGLVGNHGPTYHLPKRNHPGVHWHVHETACCSVSSFTNHGRTEPHDSSILSRSEHAVVVLGSQYPELFEAVITSKGFDA